MLRKIIYLLRLISGSFFLNWHFRKNGFYCFTYHRVGKSTSTEFDSNVFSCTEELFEKHLIFLKKNFLVISMKEMLSIVEKGNRIEKRYAVITFDDGYFDNYEVAYPLLKKYSLIASFFLTTDFVSQKCIPWWDEISWMVSQTKNEYLYVGINRSEKISLKYKNPKLVHKVLKAVKLDNQREMPEKVNDIEKQLKSGFYKKQSNCAALFMNWEQASEMKLGGMNFGAHTLSHPILSHLEESLQIKEIVESKKIIEQRLDEKIDCFAYPVGSQNSFNSTTQAILKKNGFKLSFSYEPGLNLQVSTVNQYKLLRYPMESNRNCHRLKYLITYS